MNQRTVKHEESRSQTQKTRPESRTPAFKPVALPAVAAAMRAARPQPRRPKNHELPAILRKEAMD
jgi:hypothetical protein